MILQIIKDKKDKDINDYCYFCNIYKRRKILLIGLNITFKPLGMRSKYLPIKTLKLKNANRNKFF